MNEADRVRGSQGWLAKAGRTSPHIIRGPQPNALVDKCDASYHLNR